MPTTTEAVPTRRRRAASSRRVRRYALALILVCSVIAGISAIRLTLIVLATPAADRLVEVVPLVQPDAKVDPTTRWAAERLANYLVDSNLVLARLPGCVDRHAVATEKSATCLAIVDGGLAASPSLGELWLERVIILARTGVFGPELVDALRNSYRFAPREGWIASRRVVIGLRIHPLIPDELKEAVKRDVSLVLTSPALAAPLAGEYLRDDIFRRISQQIISTMPADEQNFLIARVRALM